MKLTNALAIAVLLTAGCTNVTNRPVAPLTSKPFVAIDASVQVAEMTRGVNVLGYDP
jgi:hypothetical protein